MADHIETSRFSFRMDERRLSIGDGDNWPITWAADGNLYAFFTDGKGFRPERKGQVGSAPVMITGDPPDIAGADIQAAKGIITEPHGAQNRKACGLIMVDERFYCLIRNVNPQGYPKGTGSSIMHADSDAVDWETVDWHWKDIGYPVWINAGRNYSAATDDYVYFVSTDGPSAYVDYQDLLLARVPREDILIQSRYRFFRGCSDSGAAVWGGFEQRKPIFHNPEGCFRPEITYNPGIQRYLLLLSSPRVDWRWYLEKNPDRRSYFALYESEHPWGPWREIVKDPEWNILEDRFQPRIPTKWISTDGMSFYLLYSCIPRGPYQFNIQRCRLLHRGQASESAQVGQMPVKMTS